MTHGQFLSQHLGGLFLCHTLSCKYSSYVGKNGHDENYGDSKLLYIGKETLDLLSHGIANLLDISK